MVKYRKDLPRSIDLIEPMLRAKLRGVVNGDDTWPLVLIGGAGRGKTCAALCLLDYSEQGGDYFTVANLCNRLIQCQQGRLEQPAPEGGGSFVIWPEKFWRNIAWEPLVVMDELGCRDRPSDAHYEAVKEVIEMRTNKPLVVISNLSMEKIAQVYDARIVSRLAAGTVFCLEGEDRRL